MLMCVFLWYVVQLYCTTPQNMDHAGFYVDGASWGDTACNLHN